MRKLSTITIIAAIATMAACTQTDEGEFQVETPDVDVSTDTSTVRTPDVDVSSDTLNVPVPDVDVNPPPSN